MKARLVARVCVCVGHKQKGDKIKCSLQTHWMPLTWKSPQHTVLWMSVTYAWTEERNLRAKTLCLQLWEIKLTIKMINKNTSLMQLISIYFNYSKSLHVSGSVLPETCRDLLQVKYILISCIKLVFLFIIIWCTEKQNWNLTIKILCLMRTFVISTPTL